MKKANPIPQSERRSFYRELEARGLDKEFLELCRAGKTTTELRAWAKSKPALAGVYVPSCFKVIRKTLGVSLPQGGGRHARGKALYSVRGLRS